MTDCPPPMVSMEMVALPNEDGSLMVVSTADTETSLVVASYDMRLDQSQATVNGEIEMTNKRNRRAIMRYCWRRSIDPGVRPVLTAESPICYDYAKSMLVVLVEVKVDAGVLHTEPLDWSVPLHPAADINQDGTVDSSDQGILFSDWGTDATRSDLDRSGKVDGSDLGILNARWNWTAPQPEE